MNRHSRRSLFAITLLFVFVINFPAFAENPYDITVHPGSEVAVPGHLLGPGHYSLRRVDPLSPHTYSLTDDETMKVVDVFHVIPDQRTTFGKSSVALSAPDAAGLRMIKGWYSAGSLQGYQFIYSKKDTRELDKLARSQVTGSAAGQP